MRKLGGVFLILIILSTSFALSTGEQINAEINSINADLDSIANHIENNEAALAKQKIAELNEVIQDKLVSSSFYYGIVEERRENQGYTPITLNEIPPHLYPEEWDRLSSTLKDQFVSLTQKMDEARQAIALAKYKTALSVLLAASYQMYDISTKFSGAGNVEDVATFVGKFAVKEYLNYKYNLSEKRLFAEHVTEGILIESCGKEIEVLVNNFKELNKTKNGQQQIIEGLERNRNIILQQYRDFHQARQDTLVLTYDVMLLESNLNRLRTQIQAATSLDPLSLSQGLEFDSQEYVKTLDSIKDDLLDGEISWENYLTAKRTVYSLAQEQYANITDLAITEGSSTVTADRDYNEFITYYNTFDAEELSEREAAINGLTEKISDWQLITRELLQTYDEVNFNDLTVPSMNPISVSIDYVNSLDNSKRQCTNCYTINNFNQVSTISLGSLSVEFWYEPLTTYCGVLTNDARMVSNLVNAARENKAYNDRAGEPGFSTLFSSLSDSSDTISNLADIKTLIKSIPGYGGDKVSELSIVNDLLSSARDSVQAISTYVASVDEVYLPGDYCANNYVTISSHSKIPDVFGTRIDPCEVGVVYDFIEQDLNDFEHQVDNLVINCNTAEGSVDELLSFEQQKLDFIINLGATVDDLVSQMQPHLEILSTINELRDTYSAYLSDGGDPYAMLSFMDESIQTINQYEGLNEFISLQNSISELTSQIKPVSDGSQLFTGSYSVLESDKESVESLISVTFTPSSDINLDSLANGLTEVSVRLQEPYNEVLSAVENVKVMRGLRDAMAANRFQLEHYSTYLKSGDLWVDNTEQSVFQVANNQWQCQVLGAYALSDGFEGDPNNQLLYNETLNDYLFIVKTFRDKQLKRELEIEVGTPRDYVYLYPESVDYLVPDESLSDPLLSVIYPYFSQQQLRLCNMSDYVDDWERLAGETQESSEDAYWLERSISEGIDYLYSPEGRLNYLSTYGDWCEYASTDDPDCAGREFWLKKSREDGLDYFNRQADGSYPPYTGESATTDYELEYEDDYEEELVTADELIEVVGEELVNKSRVAQVVKRSSQSGDVFVVSSRENARLFGFIPVSVEVQTFINANSTSVTEVKRPWWSFLLFFND